MFDKTLDEEQRCSCPGVFLLAFLIGLGYSFLGGNQSTTVGGKSRFYRSLAGSQVFLLEVNLGIIDGIWLMSPKGIYMSEKDCYNRRNPHG